MMSEADVIKKYSKSGPITVDSLKEDLTDLGVKPGMVLLVHSSLSSLGFVSGGPVAVILALEEVLGPEGTLVMPTHSGDLTDPGLWENPPVPSEWHEIIRQTMPAFDPALTPSRKVGKIPETFRTHPRSIRSNHPHMSFAALGKLAEIITRDHDLHFSLGENSPLARIYDLKGWILLLGVSHENNTSLHLAEVRAEYSSKKEIQQWAPILLDGVRQGILVRELEEHSEEFEEIGKAYQASGATLATGKIGNAPALLIPQQELVDFAVEWITKNRK
ncbi:MAG: AAC(3) family N-acetyltransferase [Anaerolineales bacterium]|nr:AAC(3) family N-acetyltransferase [Anaerolineales bacterium]